MQPTKALETHIRTESGQGTETPPAATCDRIKKRDRRDSGGLRVESVEDECKSTVETTTVLKRAKPQACAWLATGCCARRDLEAFGFYLCCGILEASHQQ